MAEHLRSTEARRRGQHFLKSQTFADRLVHATGISRSDLVLDIGAGKGRLTVPLIALGARVIAIEADDQLARTLMSKVDAIVVRGNFLDFPLPAEPYRVMANVPFSITTALLRKLLDQPSAMVRADLIVELGVAIKRTRALPSNYLNLRWGPWWKFRLSQKIPRTAFEPRPSVDAALLQVIRRTRPHLDEDDRDLYLNSLEMGFSAQVRLRKLLDPLISSRDFKRAADRISFSRDCFAWELDLSEWVELVRIMKARVTL